MESFNERRYDRQQEDERNGSPRDQRNESGNTGRNENPDYNSQPSGNNYGDRGYGSKESWRRDRSDWQDSPRNDNRNQNSRGSFRNPEDRNERESDRGYGGRYSNENYARQHYSGNGGRDSRYTSGSGENYGSNEYSDYGNRGANQSPQWEGRNDEDYNDWSNGRKSRGLGRSERGQNFGESHRGKGPKNYTRSDSRIKEDISDALTDHHGIDASDIDIEISGGTVILKGTVDSRQAKRQAEDAIENISGVRNVENRIHLKSENSSRNGDRTEKSNSHSEKSNSDSKARNGKISA